MGRNLIKRFDDNGDLSARTPLYVAHPCQRDAAASGLTDTQPGRDVDCSATRVARQLHNGTESLANRVTTRRRAALARRGSWRGDTSPREDGCTTPRQTLVLCRPSGSRRRLASQTEPTVVATRVAASATRGDRLSLSFVPRPLASQQLKTSVLSHRRCAHLHDGTERLANRVTTRRRATLAWRGSRRGDTSPRVDVSNPGVRVNPYLHLNIFPQTP